MITPCMPTQTVTEAFEAAVGKWTTCDWATEFGCLNLNLKGLRSPQLERLAFATRGEESQEWRNAADWVRIVEDAAAKAQELATLAHEASLRNEHSHSRQLIQQACEIEAVWHRELIWQPLCQAISVCSHG